MGEETVHRRKSWRGFFARRSFRVFMRRANARYSSKRRSNIHTLFVVLDRWRPGFSRLEGGEFGRSTGKEIEQGEIRARAFFASNRPLNDRERRFLLRDLLPFSLSARHDFSFPLSLSLSPYLRLSLLLFLLFLPSLFLLLVPPARGTKARCVNSRKNGLVLLFH